MHFSPYCLSLHYGQKHTSELRAAAKIAALLGACEHRTMQLSLADFGGSALTDAALDVPTSAREFGKESTIPITYVPARNTIMLSLSLAWAEVLGAQDIFIGVNSVDYSGYPDCRPEYILTFEKMANLATKAAIEGKKMTIHAPLMHLSKGQIIQKGVALKVDYAETVTCYQADEEGRACGQCEACHLRRAGFLAANIDDQTRYIAS